MACSNGHLQVIEVLLADGRVNVNATDKVMMHAAKMFAVKRRSELFFYSINPMVVGVSTVWQYRAHVGLHRRARGDCKRSVGRP